MLSVSVGEENQSKDKISDKFPRYVEEENTYPHMVARTGYFTL